MIIFLPLNIWKNKRGFRFRKPVTYLKVGYHTGQDFFTSPVGSVPVIAPCNGSLKTFSFSKDAGWWGYYKFKYDEEIYSLRILHMYNQMKDGEYKEGEILGYCGATGLSTSLEYGNCYIRESHEEQSSDKAVPHLHVELHRGEFKNDTNRIKVLADERLLDPVIIFEKWVNEESSENISIERKKIEEIKDVMPKEQENLIKQNKTKQRLWDIIQNVIKNWIKMRK